MMNAYFLMQHMRKALLITLVCLSVVLWIEPGQVYANSVSINDQSGVLDANRVRSEASQLPDAVLVYTTHTFTGDQTALDNDASRRITSKDMIDIEIDTAQRHLSIQSGTNSKLSDGEASEAVDAFRNNFNNGDYTGATIAAIDSLHNSLSGASSTSGITVLGIVVAIVLAIAALVLLVIGITRRQRGNRPPGGGRGWGNRGYGPGYYPYPGYNNSANNPGTTASSGGGAGGSFGGGGFGGGFGGGGGGAGGSF